MNMRKQINKQKPNYHVVHSKSLVDHGEGSLFYWTPIYPIDIADVEIVLKRTWQACVNFRATMPRLWVTQLRTVCRLQTAFAGGLSFRYA